MKKLIYMMFLMMLGLGAVACDNERGFEDTGEEMGETFEEAGEEMDDATE